MVLADTSNIFSLTSASCVRCYEVGCVKNLLCHSTIINSPLVETLLGRVQNCVSQKRGINPYKLLREFHVYKYMYIY